jgi:hypothetical protein
MWGGNKDKYEKKRAIAQGIDVESQKDDKCGRESS